MRKAAAPLVCQHLENIGRDAIEKYQKIIRQYVHGKSGVYALYNNEKLYYVGLASNLNSRLKHHINDRHANTWNRFSAYLTQGDEHLREIEALLIRIASPRGNRQVGKLRDSENLKKRLIVDFRNMHKEEERGIFSEKISRSPQIEIKEIQPAHNEGKHKAALAPYIKKRIHIRFTYKGNLFIAHVRRNGTISFAKESCRADELQGKIYYSPSLAGKAVTGRPVDGWLVWKYQNASGNWVKLDFLRGNQRGK
jgi:hypothetical protein